jgi:D-alanyl-D-alanine carboxypeptidase
MATHSGLSNVKTADSTVTDDFTVTDDLVVGGSATLPEVNLDADAVTLSSNAGTITKNAARITTESLSTAHTASQALTITKTGVAAGDLAFATISGGTNSAGLPGISKVVCTSNTVTITLTNYAASTNAFNGTFIIDLLVAKP